VGAATGTLNPHCGKGGEEVNYPCTEVMKTKAFACFGLVAAQTLLSGCATPALWEEGRFARYHEPASPVRLQLGYCERKKDVLVVYDESREDSDAILRRAFWLEQNRERLEQRRKPSFVSATAFPELTPVPVYDQLPGFSAASGSGLYAVISTNRNELVLYSRSHGGTAPAWGSRSYSFPVYRDASGRVKQVMLTPAAVTVDLTIGAGVVAYAALPGLWLSLNYVNH
jgi:hypothetical protein